MKYSFSRIRQWLECPAKLAMYRKYVLQEPAIMQAGKLAHEVFEAYFRHCVDAGTLTDIVMLPVLAEEIYTSTRLEYGRDRKPYLSREQFEELLKDIIIPFGETHLVDINNIGGIEEKMCVTRDLRPCDWDDTDYVWFRGVIDLLLFDDEETARIRDYKTGWSVDANKLQFDVYAWLMFALYPHINRVVCEFDYVRFNKQKTTEYDREDFTSLDAEIRSLIDRIEADAELLPTPGAHCLNCEYKQFCQAAVIPPDAIVTEDDAKTTVEALALMERDVKTLKDKLRGWCTHNGNVIHNGLDWGHHSSVSDGFLSAEAFYKAAVQAGVKDPWQYLNVNMVKAKKLKDKTTHEFENHLAQVALKNVTVKFSGKKEGDDE